MSKSLGNLVFVDELADARRARRPCAWPCSTTTTARTGSGVTNCSPWRSRDSRRGARRSTDGSTELGARRRARRARRRPRHARRAWRDRRRRARGLQRRPGGRVARHYAVDEERPRCPILEVQLPDGSPSHARRGFSRPGPRGGHRHAAREGRPGGPGQRPTDRPRRRRSPDGADVAIVTPASDSGRDVLRHSSAHVLAQAVTRLWPGAQYAIGPAIADGFYYDFELPGGAHFSDDDLARIEAEMRAIIAEDQPFTRSRVLDRGGSRALQGPAVQGRDHQRRRRRAPRRRGPRRGRPARRSCRPTRTRPPSRDLCRGPHVPSTSRLGHFKLMRVAGAYWRGDEKRPQLQRIYGTAWEIEGRPAGAPRVQLEQAETARPPHDSVPDSTSSPSRARSVRASRYFTPRAARCDASWRTTRAPATSRAATSS